LILFSTIPDPSKNLRGGACIACHGGFNFIE